MQTDAVLSLRDLTVSFRDRRQSLPALKGLDLDIPRGKTVCLVGESGCGKSLTARSILRILDTNAEINSGEILFDGFDLAKPGTKDPALRRIRGRHIGLIYQEPLTAISTFYTIGNQIVEAIRQHEPISKKDARARAIEMLRAVGMPNPEQRFDAYTFELSGGQRQRAMIAMALAPQPSLLIADEPTTALDVTTQAAILDLMRELQRERGMSILFITHDLGVVSRMADEVVVMYLGEVVEQGANADVLGNPQHPYTRALLASLPGRGQHRQMTIPGMVPTLAERPAGCAFAARCAFARQGLCDFDLPNLYYQGGVAVRCHAYGPRAREFDLKTTDDPVHARDMRSPRPGDSTVLRTEGLSKHFGRRGRPLRRTEGDVRAVDDVTLTLRGGETLALVGESGCGKSTLGHTILGLYEASAGKVVLSREGQEQDITNASEAERRKIWQWLRMIFQDPFSSLNPRMTAFEIVAEPVQLGSKGKISSEALRERVHGVMRRVGIDPALSGRYPHAFSGGQRQRLGVARALAVSPGVIIADEAVSALDVSVQAQVLNLLRDLQAELGLSYLFISHDLNVVGSISHRIAVMYAGRIVELAATDDVLDRPRHPYTEALLGAVLIPGQTATEQRKPLRGGPPDPANLPPGCSFAQRCPYATDVCSQDIPAMTNKDGHATACHRQDELDLKGIVHARVS